MAGRQFLSPPRQNTQMSSRGAITFHILIVAIFVLLWRQEASAADYLLTPSPASCPPTQKEQAQPQAVMHRAVMYNEISPVTRANFFIGASAAVARLKSHVLIVDGRPAAAAAQVWIPAAIRVPLNLLEANSMVLQATEVLLIGDIADEHELLGVAQELNLTPGKSVRVVAGGIREWRRAGGGVVGNTALLDRWVDLDAVQFHELLREGASAIVLGRPSPAQREAIRNLIVPASGATPKQTIASLPSLTRRSPTVLIIPDTFGVDGWFGAWSQARHDTMYAFVDSGDRYATFLRQQGQIAANSGKTLQPRCDLH